MTPYERDRLVKALRLTSKVLGVLCRPQRGIVEGRAFDSKAHARALAAQISDLAEDLRAGEPESPWSDSPIPPGVPVVVRTTEDGGYLWRPAEENDED